MAPTILPTFFSSLRRRFLKFHILAIQLFNNKPESTLQTENERKKKTTHVVSVSDFR